MTAQHGQTTKPDLDKLATALALAILAVPVCPETFKLTESTPGANEGTK